MPNRSQITTSRAAAEAIIPADAEPDVTWGQGGIDDWGWTSNEPTIDQTADQERERQ